jgi:DNA-binding transcriptional ArsR family regulator
MNKSLQPELATLADPTRRAILDMLRVAPRNAGEIAAQFPVSWPAISRHLRLLKQARLIEERRTQRHRTYALRREALLPVLAWLTALAQDQAGSLPAPGPDPVRPIVGRQDFS